MNRRLFIIIGLVVCACSSRAPEGQNPEECGDGQDNDLDGRYDCDDDGCEMSNICVEQARKAEAAAKIKTDALKAQTQAQARASANANKSAAPPQQLPTFNLDGLMVQTSTNGGDIHQKNAEMYCEKLNLANHGDWRLPTREEAVKIVESGQLVGEPSYVMWTSTMIGKSRAIIVGMSGAVNELGVRSASQCQARCVRGDVTK